jgi:hypothetical protein
MTIRNISTPFQLWPRENIILSARVSDEIELSSSPEVVTLLCGSLTFDYPERESAGQKFRREFVFERPLMSRKPYAPSARADFFEKAVMRDY